MAAVRPNKRLSIENSAPTDIKNGKGWRKDGWGFYVFLEGPAIFASGRLPSFQGVLEALENWLAKKVVVL